MAYTWSRTISEADSSGRGTAVYTGSAGETVSNHHYRNIGRGLASFNIPHDLTLNYVYQLPFGPGKPWLSKGLASRILGGWEVNGIVSLKDGQPFSITGGGTPSDLSVLNVTPVPNVVPGMKTQEITWGAPNVSQDPTGRQRYFNPEAFSLPGPRQIGNVGRNTMMAPGTADWDFGLSKNFQFTEQMRLQFRAEFFNLFNRPHFSFPSAGIFDANGRRVPTAGIIPATTVPSREIQFGLKLVF